MAKLIGITGGNGFLGFHLRTLLRSRGIAFKVADLNSATPPDFAALTDCDAIVHLAGVNRASSEQEVYDGNLAACRTLVEALERAGAAPHVLFSSSVHIRKETVYARAKRDCAALLKAWAGRSDGRFTNLILPNLFGEYGRPFYNSATATFCHQLAAGETPQIIQDGDIPLLHAQQAARAFLDPIEQGCTGELEVPGRHVMVSELLSRLREMHDLLSQGNVMPGFADDFQRDLCNTLRSYYFPKRYPWPLKKHSDPRGTLVELVRSFPSSQSFFSTTNPGQVRGQHYHLHKLERFIVLKGSGRIRIRKLFSSEVSEFQVNGDEPSFVDIPTMHTHSLINDGSEELVTFFWAHPPFDAANPDTYAEQV